MSRVLHLDMDVPSVTAFCTKRDLLVSVIEPLESGGTRLVLQNSVDAARARTGMKNRIIDGAVIRSGLYQLRRPVPR